MEQLSPRDKKILIVGAVAAAAILLVKFAFFPTFEHWRSVKNQIEIQQTMLERIGLSDSDQAQKERKRLAQAVPTFQMPQAEDQQRQLFLTEFDKQLREVGIRTLSILPNFETRVMNHPDTSLGLKILRLKCRGTCRFNQAMDLLAALYKNPYLYTIEEIHLACGKSDREQMELTLIISTLCKI
jgi:hypothetical protein